MKISAIIAAGGSGSRLGVKGGKQLIELAGIPVMIRALQTITTVVDEVIIVISAESINICKDYLKKFNLSDKVKSIVASGETRTESVHKGLQNVSENMEFVLVHDGARPFISVPEIKKTIEAAAEHGAAVLAVPIKDTVKIESNGFVKNTPDRKYLWTAQTPQVIKKDIFLEAYAKISDLTSLTDDVSLIEQLGKKVKIVPGCYNNIKITTQEDLAVANIILSYKSST